MVDVTLYELAVEYLRAKMPSHGRSPQRGFVGEDRTFQVTGI